MCVCSKRRCCSSMVGGSISVSRCDDYLHLVSANSRGWTQTHSHPHTYTREYTQKTEHSWSYNYRNIFKIIKAKINTRQQQQQNVASTITTKMMARRWQQRQRTHTRWLLPTTTATKHTERHNNRSNWEIVVPAASERWRMNAKLANMPLRRRRDSSYNVVDVGVVLRRRGWTGSTRCAGYEFQYEK